MSTLSVSEFDVEPGEGWTVSRDANRVLLHREDVEVILSVFHGGEGLLERLREMAVRSASSAAAHPDLEPCEPSTSGRTWFLSTATRDGQTHFGAFVARGRASVLLLTFESANTPTRSREFEQLRRCAETSDIIAL